MSNTTTETVVTELKRIIVLHTKREAMKQEIETLNEALKPYDGVLPFIIANSSTSPKAVRPELSMDAVLSFVKEKGGSVKAGEFTKHFGSKWAKWRKEKADELNQAFTTKDDGTSVVWTAK